MDIERQVKSFADFLEFQARERGREEGREQGRKKGREEGREEGREQGRHEGQCEATQRERRYEVKLLLKHTGKSITPAGSDRLETASAEDLLNWIEALGNYVRIHTGATSHLVRETMTGLESTLDPETFLRVHRSTIVNIGRCRELRPLPHGEYEVFLKDGTRLVLSRRYRARLRGRFGLDP